MIYMFLVFLIVLLFIGLVRERAESLQRFYLTSYVLAAFSETLQVYKNEYQGVNDEKIKEYEELLQNAWSELLN